ncbi:MAG: immunity 30 family protein [Flavobacteriaceae bacterium]|jgi:hypothetical protein|nr:immunity 30 family protein [Flavobacteriaceae bacterium]
MESGKEYFGHQLINNRMMSTLEEVEAFEQALVALCESPSLTNVPLFVTAFDDDCEAYDVMFGLVHAMEAQDSAEVSTDDYVQTLLAAVPLFRPSAKEWSEIVFLRMLNSEQHHQILKQILGITSSDVKERVKQILLDILQSDPQRFEFKCNYLLEEL